MKKIKILIAVLLSLCLAFAVTGCSGDNLKDSVINGFNDMLQHFSKYALTDEKDLQGDKTKGEDTYTGSYTACLLYTSPSPRDISGSRMPASA